MLRALGVWRSLPCRQMGFKRWFGISKRFSWWNFNAASLEPVSWTFVASGRLNCAEGRVVYLAGANSFTVDGRLHKGWCVCLWLLMALVWFVAVVLCFRLVFIWFFEICVWLPIVFRRFVKRVLIDAQWFSMCFPMHLYCLFCDVVWLPYDFIWCS